MRMDDTDLAEETYRLLRQVPRGRVTTYGSLAQALGAIEASRLVGQYMAQNPYAPQVPCHRVVGSDGSLTGYAGGLEAKRWLLAHEGALSPRASPREGGGRQSVANDQDHDASIPSRWPETTAR